VTAEAAGAVPDANFLTFDIRENRPHRVSPAGRLPAAESGGSRPGRLKTMTTGWRESALRLVRGGRRAVETRVIGA
jgi:hypothetical protein